MEVLQSVIDSRLKAREGFECVIPELYSLVDEPQEDGTFIQKKGEYQPPEDLPWRGFSSAFMQSAGIGSLPTYANTDPHEANEKLMDIHVIETQPNVEEPIKETDKK